MPFNPQARVDVTVNGEARHQTMDGFGVNLNSKYWDKGGLLPALELLVDDLGATLFRVDAYGNSDWPDPEGKLGPASLEPKNLEKAYAGQAFQDHAAVGKYLNSRGIQPYLNISGKVPRWMTDSDGQTLKDFEAFGEMAASYVEWARKKAGIQFTLFGPLNETDIGAPEGPKLGPAGYVKACEAVVKSLDKRGLKDIQLVVAEQARYNLDFFNAFLKSRLAAERVGVFGFHTYGETDASLAPVQIRESRFKKARVWMTEFGDLDQSGEKEWYIAWMSYERLLRLLQDGLEGAMNWDAFDNVHDHNECWTTYGLLHAGMKLYTPKKRFWAMKQVYRFVRPGWQRITAGSHDPSVGLAAFVSPDGRELTVTGRNTGYRDLLLNISVEGFKHMKLARRADVYRTSATENCARVAQTNMTSPNWPLTGLVVELPANTIFTATTIK